MIRTIGGGALIRLTGWHGKRSYLLAVQSIAAIAPNVVLSSPDNSAPDEIEGAIVHLHGACGGTGGWCVDQTVAEIEALILGAAS